MLHLVVVISFNSEWHFSSFGLPICSEIFIKINLSDAPIPLIIGNSLAKLPIFFNCTILDVIRISNEKEKLGRFFFNFISFWHNLHRADWLFLCTAHFCKRVGSFAALTRLTKRQTWLRFMFCTTLRTYFRRHLGFVCFLTSSDIFRPSATVPEKNVFGQFGLFGNESNGLLALLHNQ